MERNSNLWQKEYYQRKKESYRDYYNKNKKRILKRQKLRYDPEIMRDVNAEYYYHTHYGIPLHIPYNKEIENLIDEIFEEYMIDTIREIEDEIEQMMRDKDMVPVLSHNDF